MRPLVIVNAQANGGRAREKWPAVEAALRARGFDFDVAVTAEADEARAALARAIGEARPAIVAAGGDGAVNAVLNAIVESGRDIALGAIGLGSSNDFHKPVGAVGSDGMLAGVPVKVELAGAERVDVGRARMTAEGGASSARHFVLNASMGLIAAGNAFFNTDDRTLTWLKRRNVELAIVYTALVNLRKFRPVPITVTLEGAAPERVEITAINILKKVHFAGGMRYDTPVTARDGMFDVNFWLAMGRWQVVRTMVKLYGGRFSGRPRTRCERARRVVLETTEPLDFELDGEVAKVVRAELEVVPRAIRVCR